MHAKKADSLIPKLAPHFWNWIYISLRVIWHLSIRYLSYHRFTPSICVPNIIPRFYWKDLHYYRSVDNVYSSLADHQARDALKAQLAKDHNVSLITIPCWWDGSSERFVIIPPSPPSPSLA